MTAFLKRIFILLSRKVEQRRFPRRCAKITLISGITFIQLAMRSRVFKNAVIRKKFVKMQRRLVASVYLKYVLPFPVLCKTRSCDEIFRRGNKRLVHRSRLMMMVVMLIIMCLQLARKRMRKLTLYILKWIRGAELYIINYFN